MKRRNLIVISLLTALLAACAGNPEPEILVVDGVSWTRMDCERLPDMNVARHRHVLLDLDGEITAIGGHTGGFVITRSAEYYKDGKWHPLSPFYTHDDSFCTLLPDGRVLVGGGYEKDFGIGQTWGTEVYDPATHAFAHLPILDQKRTHANALTLADGRVVVSGNWYAEDWTETYDGEQFAFACASSEQRTFPYILDSAPDSVLVFGFIDTYNHADVLSGRVDRLDGTSFEEPLLQEWSCYPLPSGSLRKYFIGDTAARSYRWLLPAAGAAGERAFVLVEGERFSLVNWPQQLPQEGPGGPISWWEDLQVDPATETAWIWSFDPGHGGRQYLAGISYGALLRGESAEWALYYSDPVEGLPANPACLMLPEGRFLIAGGTNGSYFEATASAMVFHTQGVRKSNAAYRWGLLTGALVALALVWLGAFLARRKRESSEPEAQPAPAPDLLSRITTLMEEKQFFRRKDLRIGDIASELGTNSTYISACLNSQMGVSFPTFIARYRVAYAQNQMRREPEKLLSDIAEEAGFSNEANFFRTFRQVTGKTPSEWKESKI